MTLKTILVHLDETPRSSLRYQLALQLAQSQQARLGGLYAAFAPSFSRGAEQEKAATMHSDCAAQAAEAGVEFIWIQPDEAEALLPLTNRLLSSATYADLCVVGQSTKQSHPPRNLPERLIISSGRPVLTIPFVGNFSMVGRRIMVAWKAGRASARAIADALPLLRAADQVILISLARNQEEDRANQRSLERMDDYLRCHGVAAKLENRLISQISLGDALLNRAAEEAIDLLVCGGMVAGQLAPLAEDLLRQMTVPVLMSS
jgi:nucleotide-binding universal stress UspA family protein